MYVSLACGFVIFHVSHDGIVYSRTFLPHARGEAVEVADADIYRYSLRALVTAGTPGTWYAF
jgi:MoaA/NifB/PqqE/SkfB family radical SAM enzyme